MKVPRLADRRRRRGATGATFDTAMPTTDTYRHAAADTRDHFLVPQVRNALLAGIDLSGEFPTLSRVWENMLAVPEVKAVLTEAGGIVQPLAFDAEKFEVFADMPKPAKSRT